MRRPDTLGPVEVGARRRNRPLAPVTWVVLALAVRNVTAPWLPEGAHVPVNVALGAGLVVLARRSAVSWHALGFDRRSVGRGLGFGALAASVAVVVMALGAAVPATRGLFDDGRVSTVAGTGELAYQTLVRIPLGTVLFEELAFRGVVLALLCRHVRLSTAIGVSSGLFGLWHIVPTMAAASANDIAGAGSLALVAGSVLLTAAGGVLFCLLRTRSGHLLAPVLAHLAINDTGYVLAWIVRA